MIKIPKEIYEKISASAKMAMPEEVCGLIGGNISGDEKSAKGVYFLENMDHSGEHFSMGVKEQFKAARDMRGKGLSLIGNFHSHPQTPPIPSREDKRFACDDKISYLILSLTDIYAPVLKSYFITNGVLEEEEIVIID